MTAGALAGTVNIDSDYPVLIEDPPAPQPDAQDRILHRIGDKPAAVVDKLRGKGWPAHQVWLPPLEMERVRTMSKRMGVTRLSLGVTNRRAWG